MAIYFIVFAVLLALAVLDFFVRKDKAYTGLYLIVGLFLLFYAGFRTCGNDYEGYYEIFLSLKGAPLGKIFTPEIYVEPGYAVLNILLGNYELILFVMALATLWLFLSFFRKYSPYPFITLLFFAGLFLYPFTMGMMRQSLAIAICMWAMAEPKSKRFFWLIGTAMLFHVSSLFVILVRFLRNSFYKIKTYLLILVIAVVANLMFYEAFKIVSGFFPTFIANKLEFYLTSEEGKTLGLNAAVLIRFFTFGLAYIYREQLAKAFPKGALFVNIYFLALVIYTGFGFLPQIAVRGAVFFHHMEVIIVPMILYVADRYTKIPIFALYAAFALIRHMDMVTTYAEAYVPYTNFLFP